MIKVFSFVLLFVFITLANAQEKRKQPKAPSPSAVVKQWNQAAARRDMKTIAKLASNTTPQPLLALIQQQGWLNYQGVTKIIHEEISGDRAVVVYRLENPGGFIEIKYEIVVLVREKGQWKVTQDRGGVLKRGMPTRSK